MVGVFTKSIPADLQFKKANFPKFPFKSCSRTHYWVTGHHRNKVGTSPPRSFGRLKAPKTEPESKGVFREAGGRSQKSPAHTRAWPALPPGAAAAAPSRPLRYLRRWLLRARPGPGARPSSGAARSGPWPPEGPALPPGTAPRRAALPLPAAAARRSLRCPVRPEHGELQPGGPGEPRSPAGPAGPSPPPGQAPAPGGTGRAPRIPRAAPGVRPEGAAGRSRCVRHVGGTGTPAAQAVNGLKAACGGAVPFTRREGDLGR